MSNVFFDIETIPTQPEDETKAAIAETMPIKAPDLLKPELMNSLDLGEESKKLTVPVLKGMWCDKFGESDRLVRADEEYRKTSFDGGKGQICSIAWAAGDGVITSHTDERGESRMLIDFFADLDIKLNGKPPFFIGHYIGGFDLKFIFHRAVVLGIRPLFELPFNGRHNQHFYDNQIAWAGYKDRISQDNLCKALGIEGKPNDIDGSKVWDFYKAGKIDEIEEYNRDDVDKCRQIYKRLNFIG